MAKPGLCTRAMFLRKAVLVILASLASFGAYRSTSVLHVDEESAEALGKGNGYTDLLSALFAPTNASGSAKVSRMNASTNEGDNPGKSWSISSALAAERPWHSPYAYAFLVSGCDPDEPVYRHMLAGIYVAVYLLRKYGSTQDAIVYFMMADSSKHRTIPAEELRVLRELNATARQIPTLSNQTFHRVMLQKFRILGLSNYRRVLFLDADAIPLLNPDYLFEYSDPAVRDPPTLKENLVFIDYGAPANGGVFMLKPDAEDMLFVNDLIKEAQTVRNEGVEGNEPWRRFPPDPWDGFDRGGNAYDFHGVSGDQGLLWSWVRHYKRSFSLVMKDGSIRNYGPDGDIGVRVEKRIERPFAPDREVWPAEVSVWGTNQTLSSQAKPHDGHIGAYGNFYHYWINGKPWAGEGCSAAWNKKRNPPSAPGIAHAERAKRFWCQTYHELSVKYNASIKVSSIKGSASQLWYHRSVSPEMWATPGPITNLLDPDFDPWTLIESATNFSSRESA